jgi:hypothetical protein
VADVGRVGYADIKARVLTTNIDLDEATCSIDLLEAASEYFSIGLAAARTIIKEVKYVMLMYNRSRHQWPPCTTAAPTQRRDGAR